MRRALHLPFARGSPIGGPTHTCSPKKAQDVGADKTERERGGKKWTHGPNDDGQTSVKKNRDLFFLFQFGCELRNRRGRK